MTTIRDLAEIRREQAEFQRLRSVIQGSLSSERIARTKRTALGEVAPEYPRWQSGVPRLDEEFGGGFYGVTALGGIGGAGKSTLALGSSLLAAEAGWCVVYFDGENDLGLTNARIARWYGERELGGALARLAGYWHRIEVYAGTQLEELRDHVLALYEPRHSGVLIVLDSLNTLAEFDAKTAQESFDSMRRVLFWADRMARESSGRVASMLLSELNAAGELKGRKQQSTAQFVLAVEAQDEPDVVRLRVTKNRAGRSGDAGLHLRDWRTGRFTPPKATA
jgi:predicted ATP-dependent serine protease